MMGCALSAALCALAPGAVIARRTERDWHSATFSGKRVTLDLKWEASPQEVHDFANIIGEHEFELGDQIVADIVVRRQTNRVENEIILTVEALLLHDDA